HFARVRAHLAGRWRGQLPDRLSGPLVLFRRALVALSFSALLGARMAALESQPALSEPAPTSRLHRQDRSRRFPDPRRENARRIARRSGGARATAARRELP